jgi:hypothetical protein
MVDVILPRPPRPVRGRPIEGAPTGRARGLKAHDIAPAMKAATSALDAGVITPGDAATIAAELAMPDLDLIKQVEQGCGTGAGASHWGLQDNRFRRTEVQNQDS